ncbi:T9SS type A sorting domain-containing protein [Cytophagaceae bacterium ABcell3]|nr:T9SS type A sorting domain-containing protein [Cytophagaceae bacterium ABcell3]
MQKLLHPSLLTLIVFSVSLFNSSLTYAEFAGGDGSEDHPYQVETPEHLNAIRHNLEAAYILNQDINLDSDENWEPIAGIFSGHFNGNGHSVNGLVIDQADDDYVGFFEHIGEDAEVINFGLRHATVKGNRRVGILAGRNDGVVFNCFSTGEVEGNMIVGGLVGRHNGGMLMQCYSMADASGIQSIGGLTGVSAGSALISKCYARGHVTASGNIAGGLAGRLLGPLENSYATGIVRGVEQVGGIAGISSDTITNVYATGEVIGSELKGGLVGELQEGEIINSYWNTETSGRDQGVGSSYEQGAYGRSTQEMTGGQAKDVFENWDFEELWLHDPEYYDGYPYFQWNEELITHVEAPKEIIVQVYPNPTADYLQIEAPVAITSITIYDAMGRLVMDSPIENGITGKTKLDVQNLREGHYFVLINTDEAPVKKRFLKLK